MGCWLSCFVCFLEISSCPEWYQLYHCLCPFEFPTTVYHDVLYLSHCLRHMSRFTYLQWIQQLLSTCRISSRFKRKTSKRFLNIELPFCQDCCGSHKVSLVGLHYEPSTGLACRPCWRFMVQADVPKRSNILRWNHIICPGMWRLIDWLTDGYFFALMCIEVHI